MIVMVFEYWFDPNRPNLFEEYLAASDEVRTHLAGIDGFRGVERFQSTSDPNKYVAIGSFDDEDAVRRWRNLPAHRRVQELGRRTFFSHYRLRMAETVRDYGPVERAQAPADSRGVDGANHHGSL